MVCDKSADLLDVLTKRFLDHDYDPGTLADEHQQLERQTQAKRARTRAKETRLDGRIVRGAQRSCELDALADLREARRAGTREGMRAYLEGLKGQGYHPKAASAPKKPGGKSPLKQAGRASQQKVGRYPAALRRTRISSPAGQDWTQPGRPARPPTRPAAR